MNKIFIILGERKADEMLEKRVDLQNTAILVIDMQNDYCHPNGALAKIVGELPRVQRMIPRLRRLIDAARQTGVRIIHIQSQQTPETSSDVWLSRTKSGNDTYLCVPGTWGVEPCGVEPQENEIVVIKHRYSGFVGTNLEQILRALKIQNLIVTGVATNVCVESTARDGFMRDFFVVLVSDCCGSTSDDEHIATCKVIDRCFGIVANSNEIIPMWQKKN